MTWSLERDSSKRRKTPGGKEFFGERWIDTSGIAVEAGAAVLMPRLLEKSS
jgi:hypothetical protein